MKPSATAGLTLIEATIVVALIVPLLAVLIVAAKTLVGSFGASAQNAEITQLQLGATARAKQALLSSSRSSLRVQALAADVTAGRATAVGEWIRMPELDGRRSVELESATGEMGPALVLPTTTYRLQFTMDANEVDNGVDDDGDGMIDEGELAVLRAGDRVTSVDGVESCSFELDGRILRYSIRLAARDPSRKIRRTTIEDSVFFRNP